MLHIEKTVLSADDRQTTSEIQIIIFKASMKFEIHLKKFLKMTMMTQHGRYVTIINVKYIVKWINTVTSHFDLSSVYRLNFGIFTDLDKYYYITSSPIKNRRIPAIN
jgi:hypothetical protein